MSQYGTPEEYDHGFEDGWKQGHKAPQRPNKRKALRIVRLLRRAIREGSASDDTLAWMLQNEMEK